MTNPINFNRLTKKQQAVLGQIACDNDAGHHPQTVESLLKRGLITSYKQNLGGWPPIAIIRYEMPISVHIQWCAWCAEQVGELDD